MPGGEPGDADEGKEGELPVEPTLTAEQQRRLNEAEAVLKKAAEEEEHVKKSRYRSWYASGYVEIF